MMKAAAVPAAPAKNQAVGSPRRAPVAQSPKPAAAPEKKRVIEAGLTLPALPDEVTRHFLKYLNPTELAKMREVSTLYNNTIKGTPSLNKKVQHGKYLILAKQTAEGLLLRQSKPWGFIR